MPLSILRSLLRLLSRVISPLDAEGCSRDTHAPRFNLPQKVTNYSSHIKFYYEKISKCPALSLISAEMERHKQEEVITPGTLDIKIEVRTQRTGLSGAFVAIDPPLRLKSQKKKSRPPVESRVLVFDFVFPSTSENACRCRALRA